jgi:hypothetical protein
MVTVLSGTKVSSARPYHPPPNSIPNTSPGIDHIGYLYSTAIFRVVVFAPTVGEIILGKIISSTAEHIRGALSIATLPVTVRSRSGRIQI